MASGWTNTSAIWRDLSLAQGREVPVELDNTVIVGQDEKPPPLRFTEETEEEYIGAYAGGGDSACGPDLASITKMLKEVSGPTDESSTEDPPSSSFQLPVYNRSIGMFKKKETTQVSEPVKKVSKPTSSPKSISEPVKQPTAAFEPSSRASEYYKRYNEQREILERRNETIWTKLEREMKELDEKRKMNGVSRDGCQE